jgi:nucleotide-binding universal stress UspA family protein
MNRILIATDGSPPSAEAGVVAIELASKQRSELSFVHVVPRLDVFSAGAYTAALPREPTERDQALLEDAAAVAAEHGIVATTALRYGVTVEEIIVFADSHNVDLIVVGSRGHGALASALSRQRLAWRPARVEAPGPDRARGGRRPRSGPDTSRPKCSIIFGNGITLCGEVTGHAPVRMAGDVT